MAAANCDLVVMSSSPTTRITFGVAPVLTVSLTADCGLSIATNVSRRSGDCLLPLRFERDSIQCRTQKLPSVGVNYEQLPPPTPGGFLIDGSTTSTCTCGHTGAAL